jgi:hypothetical protein
MDMTDVHILFLLKVTLMFYISYLAPERGARRALVWVSAVRCAAETRYIRKVQGLSIEISQSLLRHII